MNDDHANKVATLLTAVEGDYSRPEGGFYREHIIRNSQDERKWTVCNEKGWQICEGFRGPQDAREWLDQQLDRPRR